MPIVLLALISLLWPTAAFAQGSAPRPGSIRATVRDSQNLPIQGAQVVAVEGNGTQHTGVTNERGMADLDAVPATSYTIRIESPGFDTLTVTGVFVRPGARTTRE